MTCMYFDICIFVGFIKYLGKHFTWVLRELSFKSGKSLECNYDFNWPVSLFWL